MELINSPYFFALLVGVIVFILYMALDVLILGRSRQSMRLKSIEDFSDAFNAGDSVSLEPQISPSAKGYQDVLRFLGVNVDNIVEELTLRCNRAGISSPDAPTYLLLYKYIIGPALAIIGGIFIFGALFPIGNVNWANLLIGIIVAFIGVSGVDLYLKNKSQKYEKVMLRSFPDMLDLLVICVESGLALDAALARICKELGNAHPEITAEVNKTRIELTLLNDRPQALMNLAERVNIVPFRSLVSALIQTEKFGTSLTDTLRVLSEDYRLTRLMVAEQKAGRLPVLMTIPLILLLIPAFVIIILAPPFIKVSAQGGIFGNIGQ